MEAGKDLPVNEFGKLSIRWVLGSFATEENSLTTYGATFSTGTSSYYVAVLNDLSVIAVQATDKSEIERLDAMTKAFSKADDVYSLTGQDFEGKIEKLTNTKLKGFYDDALRTSGIRGKDYFTPKYLILNTSAIPEKNILLYVVLPLAAIVVLIVVIVRGRKKRKAENASNAAPTDSFGSF